MADINELIEATSRARNLAMRAMLSARIPESGDFGAIAQDTDFALTELRSLQSLIAELEAERDRLERNRDMWKGQCERQAARLTPINALQDECVASLTCQRQLDMDGCEVGVSRQAVDEVHAALVAARSNGAAAPTPPVAANSGALIRVIVRMDDDGSLTFASDEPCEIITVSETVPSDRCYRVTRGGPAYSVGRDAVDDIIGADNIGHAEDERHPAIKHRIESAMAGRPHLAAVSDLDGEKVDG